MRRSWKLWLEENTRWPIQSSQEALEGNVVSRGGWLSLKEDRQDQWLQNPLGPSLPKEVIHFTKNVPRQPQRQAPKKKKGPGEPPVGSQWCHAPTQNAHKSGLLWGNFMGALVSAPSLPGGQVGVTAPVGTPPIPPTCPSLPALGLLQPIITRSAWLYGLLEMGDQAARGSPLKGTRESSQQDLFLLRGLERRPPQKTLMPRPLQRPSQLPGSPSGPISLHIPCQQSFSCSLRLLEQNTNCSLWLPSICVVHGLPRLSQTPCPTPQAGCNNFPTITPIHTTPSLASEPPQMLVPLSGTLIPPSLSDHSPLAV